MSTMTNTNYQPSGSDIPPSRISLQEMVGQGFLEEVARIYNTRDRAVLLLDQIGFPESHTPAFDTPLMFWRSISKDLDDGLVEGGIRGLLEKIAGQYRENIPLGPFRRSPAPGGDNVTRVQHEGEAINVHINGWRHLEAMPTRLLQRINAVAAASGVDQGARLSFSTEETLAFSFIGNDETAAILLNRIQEEIIGGATDVRISMGPQPEEGDYVLSRIFVVGPDQGRFQISNIPASTPISDIGATLLQHYEGSWPVNSDNTPRNMVIDHVSSNGTTERINSPTSTLHDNHVRDGDSLQASPESTAASPVNPVIRQQALARAKMEMQGFANDHPTIRIETNSKSWPTQYILSFTENGWAPPETRNQPPRSQLQHKVYVVFEHDFPMSAPSVIWATPFFHPNVHPKNGSVCLGELRDRYRPGLNIGLLCLIILDIAGYRNYQTASSLNVVAAEWAESEEGQRMIVEQGGRPRQTNSAILPISGIIPFFKIEKI